MAVGAEALLNKTVAGKYLVLQLLGHGAMGNVYRAKHLTLDKEIALKVLHPNLRHDENFVERFHREAKSASKLNHPNSVQILDYGEDSDGCLFIAMELLEGRDLFQVIHQDKPLSRDRIIDILRQVLAAVGAAHNLGIIHRDLKPENVMVHRRLDDEGESSEFIKVCDFGIAKMIERDLDEEQRTLSMHGHLVGTPEYMSPEQARGEKIDARSDVYALGVVLYQMLVARPPFEGPAPLDIAVKHVTELPVPPSARGKYPVDPELEAVCLKALSKDPKDRFQSAREMRTALRVIKEGRGFSGESSALWQTVPPGETAPVGKADSSDAFMPVAVVGPDGAPVTRSPTVRGLGHSVKVEAAKTVEPVSSSPILARASSRVTPHGTEAPSREPAPKKPASIWIWGGMAAGVIALYFAFQQTKHRDLAESEVEVATATNPSQSSIATEAPSATAVLPHTRDVQAASPSPSIVHPRVHATLGRRKEPAPAPSASPALAPAVVVDASVQQDMSSGVLGEPAPPKESKSEPKTNVVFLTNTGHDPAPASLKRALTTRTNAFRSCYAKRVLEAHSCAAGTATLDLSADAAGRIEGASLAGADFLPGLASCASVMNGAAVETTAESGKHWSVGVQFSCAE